MMPFPHLFSSLEIRGHTLPSRAVITAHGASESFRSPAGNASLYVDYLRKRAEGGAGLIIAQPHFPDPVNDPPKIILDRYTELATAVKPAGAVLVAQAAHLGVYGKSDSDPRRPPLWGFGDTWSADGEGAHKMTDEQVERMVDAYRKMARLYIDAGLDGVEVHGAHGYLIQQSLTPWSNDRSDRWGQDRTLFVRRIIEEVRNAIGPDKILVYRTTTDDFRSPDDGGMGLNGVVASLKAILGLGMVDVLNTTVGDGGKSYARAIPDFRNGEATNIPYLKRLREELDITIPVVGVGRIVSPGSAESVLSSGVCDLVAMTRAHIADPEILAKARAGRGDRIRPCVGANVCVNRKLSLYPDISCLHNPEVLRERELAVTPTEAGKKLVVVGSGPAGLKAAEVAARRGHSVVLLERSVRLGGRLRAVEQTAGSQLAATLDHLVSELEILGVGTRVGIDATAAVIAAETPDHVVLATGTVRRPDDHWFGGETARIFSSDEALTEDTGKTVLVVDAIGTNEAALVAEALALQGKKVVFATSFDSLVPHAGQLHRWVVPDVLRDLMAAIHTSAVVGYVDGTKVSLVYADGEPLADVEVDSIVNVLPRLSNVDLVDGVRELGVAYTVIGDAVAPRGAWHAFKEGQEAALAV
jgi:2,4-dienoyl-CoA reductase-like NADH-dependent reductase (Old Yellow Enzyme family)